MKARLVANVLKIGGREKGAKKSDGSSIILQGQRQSAPSTLSSRLAHVRDGAPNGSFGRCWGEGVEGG